MVLSRVGELGELGEGSSYGPGSVVSEKSIWKIWCKYVGLVHMHTLMFDVCPCLLPNKLYFYLICPTFTR